MGIFRLFYKKETAVSPLSHYGSSKLSTLFQLRFRRFIPLGRVGFAFPFVCGGKPDSDLVRLLATSLRVLGHSLISLDEDTATESCGLFNKDLRLNGALASVSAIKITRPISTPQHSCSKRAQHGKSSIDLLCLYINTNFNNCKFI